MMPGVARPEKYYSVDQLFNRCGEASMKPKEFGVAKLFEPGITKVSENSSCAARDFTVLEATETHSVGPFEYRVEKYKKTPDTITVDYFGFYMA